MGSHFWPYAGGPAAFATVDRSAAKTTPAAGEEVQAGRRGDKRKRGRWALEELLEVRRVRGRGRGLEVRVRWSGGDATGRSWEDSWVGVTWLTHDLRREAREMEVELY